MAPLLAARAWLAFQCWEDAQADRGPLWASLGTCNLAMDHRGARNPLILEPWVAAVCCVLPTVPCPWRHLAHPPGCLLPAGL